MTKSKSFSLFALAAIASSTCFVTPAAASLIVNPISQAIAQGGTAAVNIDISGLGNGSSPALGAYTGLVVAYDNTILTPVSVTFSSRLGDPTDPAQTLLLSNIFLPSAVELDGVSFLTAAQLFAAQANANNQFTIATINFTGIANGVSPITLSYGALSDENANALTESIVNGSVTVSGATSGIPEPATAGFLGAGLVAAIALARKKKAA